MGAMLSVGSIRIDPPVMLAPMAGYCDLAYRLTVRACGGVGLAFTDLLCPHGILRRTRRTMWLAATNERDRPLAMQLYGRDPHLMAEAAKRTVDRGADVIDINMGCPVRKITKKNAGAKLLLMPDQALAVTEAIVEAVGGRAPVTVKTRLGYRAQERTAPGLARRLVEAGAAMITIHGRRAEQEFAGPVDLDGIAAVVDAVHAAGDGRVPCIGNGDVRTPFDARRMMGRTGCDGVMIGRAAVGAPWLPRDTAALLATGDLPEPPTLRDRLELLRTHFRHVLQHRGERVAVSVIRQRLARYSPHLGPSKPLHVEMNAARSADQIDAAINAFIEQSGPAADEVPVTWQDRAEIFAHEAAARAHEPAAV